MRRSLAQILTKCRNVSRNIDENWQIESAQCEWATEREGKRESSGGSQRVMHKICHSALDRGTRRREREREAHPSFRPPPFASSALLFTNIFAQCRAAGCGYECVATRRVSLRWGLLRPQQITKNTKNKKNDTANCLERLICSASVQQHKKRSINNTKFMWHNKSTDS